MTSEGLEKLETWQKAREFANAIYREVMPLLPPEEKYNLASQMRRAATSIPANIAEGYGRFYYQSNILFCYNARGSLEETLSHLILAHDLGYINEKQFLTLKEKGNNLVLLINGYVAYLKRSKHGENEPGSPGFIKDEHQDYGTDSNED